MAETVAWVQRNADVLVDSHGIGGDPSRGEPYGFASWAPRMGILAVRNPSTKPAEIAVDVQQAFELPRGAGHRYMLVNPWKGANQRSFPFLQGGKPFVLKLAPLEVLTFEAHPAY